jgi:hypothetical protein
MNVSLHYIGDRWGIILWNGETIHGDEFTARHQPSYKVGL